MRLLKPRWKARSGLNERGWLRLYPTWDSTLAYFQFMNCIYWSLHYIFNIETLPFLKSVEQKVGLLVQVTHLCSFGLCPWAVLAGGAGGNCPRSWPYPPAAPSYLPKKSSALDVCLLSTSHVRPFSLRSPEEKLWRRPCLCTCPYVTCVTMLFLFFLLIIKHKTHQLQWWTIIILYYINLKKLYSEYFIQDGFIAIFDCTFDIQLIYVLHYSFIIIVMFFVGGWILTRK